MNELRNKSGLEFIDISSENVRWYIFEGGQIVEIEYPSWLHVSPSGGHRILDAVGICHYIPPTWIHLCWRVGEGCPHFVK